MADTPRDPPSETPATPVRRRRQFLPDPDERARLTTHVLDVCRAVQDERAPWMQIRADRYAKLRGWTQARDWPWTHASNQHMPVMMAASLRVKAGLFNAVLGIRPVMSAKTLQKQFKAAAERAASLIDHQVFAEANGEEKIAAFIDAFVDDGTAIAFIPWIRDRRVIHDVRLVARPPGELAQVVPQLLTDTVFTDRGVTDIVREDEDGYRWTATLPPRDALKEDPTDVTIEVYDVGEQGTTLEIVLEWEATVYDGPALIVHDLEDILVPLRAENCQPLTPNNPGGSPWIARRCRTDLDTIRRKKADGTYDLLSDEGLAAMVGLAEGRAPTGSEQAQEDLLKQQKDTLVGQAPGLTATEEREWLTILEWYGRWDVDGDTLEEDVIAWVCRETGTLLRMRALTELYPGLPPRRPLAEARYIPVNGEFYGIGLLELMESLNDFLHVVLNQTVDNGTLANLPFFFYRASSGFKPEVIHLTPGEGYPTDTPQQDVYFPTLPAKDQSFGFNLFSLGMQIMNQLTQIGPIQFGQVPTGKASALRTTGTTMAILQQGAAMPEQVLRRLFTGLAQMWAQIHALNLKYLPRRKEFLVAGKPLEDEDAYGRVDNPEQELNVPVTFDFQATLLNTNKGMMSQALQALGAALVSPLMLQLGLVTPEQIYNWGKDLIQANELDPARYLRRPPTVPETPRLLAEEAISSMLQGRLPVGTPLEPTAEHLQKLQQFMLSEQVGLLGQGGLALFRVYLDQVLQRLRTDQQQQQMMQAAQTFSQTLQNQGQGQGGVPSTMEAPAMQSEAPSTSEMAGAMGSGGGGGA